VNKKSICTENMICTESESYVTTDGQPASLSWSKAPIWGLRPDLYYCPTVAGLLIWGALSDERTGLSFVYAAGPCQRSLSRVRVPWDLRTYFTVSDLRLHFSSPPTTRRVTVEVFDHASTRLCYMYCFIKLNLIGTKSELHIEALLAYCFFVFVFGPEYGWNIFV
jgi:hypothetical protein